MIIVHVNNNQNSKKYLVIFFKVDLGIYI